MLCKRLDLVQVICSNNFGHGILWWSLQTKTVKYYE